MKEFKLSERREYSGIWFLKEEDVKEFIKIIINEFMRQFYGSDITTKEYEDYLDFIKNKAGEKLI